MQFSSFWYLLPQHTIDIVKFSNWTSDFNYSLLGGLHAVAQTVFQKQFKPKYEVMQLDFCKLMLITVQCLLAARILFCGMARLWAWRKGRKNFDQLRRYCTWIHVLGLRKTTMLLKILDAPQMSQRKNK